MMRKTFALCTAVLLLGGMAGWAQETTIIDETTEVTIVEVDQEEIDELKAQVKDLEKTINATKCDVVVIGTPIDLGRILNINKPSTRVMYELQEIGANTLESVLKSKGIM